MVLDDRVSVVYGGTKPDSHFFKEPWNRAYVVIGEDIKMLPFEKDRSIVPVDIFKVLDSLSKAVSTKADEKEEKYLPNAVLIKADEKEEKSQPQCVSDLCKIS